VVRRPQPAFARFPPTPPEPEKRPPQPPTAAAEAAAAAAAAAAGVTPRYPLEYVVGLKSGGDGERERLRRPLPRSKSAYPKVSQ